MDSVFPDNSRRLRLGIWGLGRGLHIIETASLCNIDVVAGCDYNPHFLDMFRKQIPDGRFTADAEEFLSWDFDAVLLATYCPAHGPDAIRCLEAGKHVLSEVTAFLTPAEGVALVETVEKTGKIYQLAENYPYTPENRYLKRLWDDGTFGELQYAEYCYIHDCLNLAYTYIDNSPVEPGDQVHTWRSWLPWHYYCTHSLGPVMAITGNRPVKVTALPGSVQLPGHLISAPEGLSGMAPSLIEMDNGGLVRNLMGGCTNDDEFKTLYGTRGASEWVHGKLSLRLGGRGHSPMLEVEPPEDEVGRLARSSGHGGGDFWVLYHFANEILNGVSPPFDVYRAADVTLPGIQAYRSALSGGQPMDIPDFRDPEIRDRYRGDDFSPQAYDTRNGAFASIDPSARPKDFTAVMKELLDHGDHWQAFSSWRKISDAVVLPEKIDALADEIIETLPELQKTVARAKAIVAQTQGTDGARVLQSQLDRLDLDVLEAPDALERIEAMREKPRAARRARSLNTSSPQLAMIRPSLENLPELNIAPGHSIRCAQPEERDAEHWCRIIGESFEDPQTLESWRAAMVNRYDYAPERILFLCDPEGEPVATAAAYGGLIEGYVHFVGVRPKAAGRSLGYQVSLAVLNQFQERGCQRCILTTDDFRLPAIKTYWKLGFRPHIQHKSHPDRWENAARRLNIPELGSRENWIQA